MKTQTYDFTAQLRIGQEHERLLDSRLGDLFEIAAATAGEQRQGIDRHFTHRKSGAGYLVEYKADSKAGRTNNAFVETVSVDSTGKLGWAFTSRADVLIYLVTHPETIYCIPLRQLRSQLFRWLWEYPSAQAQNNGYTTYGILVPLTEFEAIASVVY